MSNAGFGPYTTIPSYETGVVSFVVAQLTPIDVPSLAFVNERRTWSETQGAEAAAAVNETTIEAMRSILKVKRPVDTVAFQIIFGEFNVES